MSRPKRGSVSPTGTPCRNMSAGIHCADTTSAATMATSAAPASSSLGMKRETSKRMPLPRSMNNVGRLAPWRAHRRLPYTNANARTPVTTNNCERATSEVRKTDSK